MLQVGGSSEESSLKSALQSGRAGNSNAVLPAQKRQTSFKYHVATSTVDTATAVVDDSETEADYVDESAIDDDESSDWEATKQ